MFTEIKNQFIDGLEEQKWMDDLTRANARLKVRQIANFFELTYHSICSCIIFFSIKRK